MDTLLSTLHSVITNCGMSVSELIQSFKDHIYKDDAHMSDVVCRKCSGSRYEN
jgi:hypothetical protein